MEAMERDFHDSTSSYDEILDFESLTVDEENDRIVEVQDEDFFYRPLDEY